MVRLPTEIRQKSSPPLSRQLPASNQQRALARALGGRQPADRCRNGEAAPECRPWRPPSARGTTSELATNFDRRRSNAAQEQPRYRCGTAIGTIPGTIACLHDASPHRAPPPPVRCPSLGAGWRGGEPGGVPACARRPRSAKLQCDFQRAETSRSVRMRLEGDGVVAIRSPLPERETRAFVSVLAPSLSIAARGRWRVGARVLALRAVISAIVGAVTSRCAVVATTTAPRRRRVQQQEGPARAPSVSPAGPKKRFQRPETRRSRPLPQCAEVLRIRRRGRSPSQRQRGAHAHMHAATCQCVKACRREPCRRRDLCNCPHLLPYLI